MSETMKKWKKIVEDVGVEKIKRFDVELEETAYTPDGREVEVRITIIDPCYDPETEKLLLHKGAVIFKYPGLIKEREEVEREIREILSSKKGDRGVFVESTAESTTINVGYLNVPIDEVINTMEKIEKVLKKYGVLWEKVKFLL